MGHRLVFCLMFAFSPSLSCNILTLGVHAHRGLQYLVRKCVCLYVRLSVCPSVCLSVSYHVFCHYAQQTGKTATPTGSGFILKWLKCCVQKLWQVNKPICKSAQSYLDWVRLLCVRWRHKKSQRMVCIDSRMLHIYYCS